jgi:hypothetical protein
MAHQGSRACHWCEGRWRKNQAYNRHCFGGHYRWLDQANPLRLDRETAPPARTPASVYRDAQISDASDLAWDDDDHPRKWSGVNGISALSLLPMFDIVWDVLPDWMHIIKNLILPHFIKLVKGKRDLKVPQYKTVPAPGSASTLEINAAVRYTPIHF